MLAEPVVTEKDFLTCHVREHRIGPVKHRRFDENEFAVAEIKRISRIDGDEVPILMVMAADNRFALFGTVNGRIRNLLHQKRQRPAVIAFIMIHNDVIDLVQVNFFFQAFYEFPAVRSPDRIHENRFLITNQIGIIRRTALRRIFLPVEIHEFPVHFTDPSNLVRDFLCHTVTSFKKTYT